MNPIWYRILVPLTQSCLQSVSEAEIRWIGSTVPCIPLLEALWQRCRVSLQDCGYKRRNNHTDKSKNVQTPWPVGIQIKMNVWLPVILHKGTFHCWSVKSKLCTLKITSKIPYIPPYAFKLKNYNMQAGTETEVTATSLSNLLLTPRHVFHKWNGRQNH